MGNESKYYDIIDIDHLEVALVQNKKNIALGLAIGPTSFRGDKIANLVICLDFLFWSLEIEIKW